MLQNLQFKMAAKLYDAAAKVIECALNKKGSAKSLCFSSKYRNKKQLFALVLETLKNRKILELLLNKADFDHVEISTSLKLVLLYEHLFGCGIPTQHRYHKVFFQHDEGIKNALENAKTTHCELFGLDQKDSYVIPRYVRINRLKVDPEEAINAFVQSGLRNVKKSPVDLLENEFLVDSDIPDLLVFRSGIDLHQHALYKEGKIILQDKASCLPAFLLDPPPQSIIIDPCAAPGNKSSHLASIIRNKGTIFSFDLDKRRLMVMTKLLHRAHATCVLPKHGDFLKVRHNHEIFSKVEYILLDPSCSGSGIVSRLDGWIDGETDTTTSVEETTGRLKRLSGFQTAALSHALQFPNVKRVVYSTCSIHKQENEDVVEKACARFSATFKLVHIMPTWKNRGLGTWEEAYKCIRASPDIDHTNGFFVAMFERIAPNEDILQNGNKVDVCGTKKDFDKKKNRKRKLKSENKVESAKTKKEMSREKEAMIKEGTENMKIDTNRINFESKKRTRRKRRSVKKPITL